MIEEEKREARPAKRKSNRKSRSACSSKVQAIAEMSYKEFCKKLTNFKSLSPKEKQALKKRYQGNDRLMRQELLHGLLADEERKMPSIEEEAQGASQSICLDISIRESHDD